MATTRAPSSARTAPKAPAPPTDPVELLRTPLHRAGLSAGPTLRRAGVKLGWYDVRDLLFRLPRRYDDLRELQRLGDLVWAEEGSTVSAQARVLDIHVEGSWRRRIQRTVARLEDDTGTVKATWFGRRYIEKRLHAGDEIVVSGRLKRFGRELTIDNPEFQAVAAEGEVLMAGRIVPVYGLTAGLTAARLRVAMLGGSCVEARQLISWVQRSTAVDDGDSRQRLASFIESYHPPVELNAQPATGRSG